MTVSASKTEREILRHVVTALRVDDTAELEIAWVEHFDAAAILSTLHQHRLHTLWFDAVTRAGAGAQLDAQLRDGLEELRGYAVARELLYDGVLSEVGETLDRSEVPWLLFKGAELARRIYEPTYLRPLVDADLLVAPADHGRAVQALEASGFVAQPGAEVADHQITLSRGGANLDLHWHLLRPGRARIDLAEHLLASRIQWHDVWIADDNMTLLVLLLHPALKDYLGKLIRAVDLVRFIDQRKPSFVPAVNLLEQAGLQAAGWLALVWVEHWLGVALAPGVCERLQPGPLRRRYLAAWLDRQPAHLFARWPTLARATFNLPLHDSINDIARATWTRKEARSRAAR